MEPHELKHILTEYFEEIVHHAKFAHVELTNELNNRGYYKFMGLFLLDKNLFISLYLSVVTIIGTQIYSYIKTWFFE
jgi:hypothetical protein